MCHAASQIHACGHSATMWTYCRESNLSGKGTAPPECRERTWGKAVKSTEPCSLAFCDFKSGSTWYAHQPICPELRETVADAVVVQDLLHVRRYPEYGRVVCPFAWQMGARRLPWMDELYRQMRAQLLHQLRSRRYVSDSPFPCLSSPPRLLSSLLSPFSLSLDHPQSDEPQTASCQ